MKAKNFVLALTIVAISLGLRGIVFAQGTAFAYLGSLNVAGSPANGRYNFQFYLRDALTGGNPVGTTNALGAVPVTNGLFGVTLDFGANFSGAARWLEIAVQTNGGANFTALTPRQPILAAPYAVFASAAGSANTAAGVSVVGGVSAASVASGATAANAATTANVAGTIVQRAGDGSFSAGKIFADGRYITNGSGPVSIFFFGAKGGTNDDTPAFQAAADAGIPVWCPGYGTNFFTINNLLVTNTTRGFGIYGENTHIVFGTNADGVCIDVATNAAAFAMHGILMEGLNYRAGADGGARMWQQNITTNIIRVVDTGHRTGLRLSAMNTNAFVSECTFEGFSDSGIWLVDGAGSFPQPATPNVHLTHCSFVNNWIGVNITNDSEYMEIIGGSFRLNGWGINIAAGNTFVSACSLVNNGVAVVVNGGSNPAHGMVSDSCLNHNDYGFIVENSNNGFEFANDYILAVGACVVTNFTGLYIHGGTFAPGLYLLVDGGDGSANGLNLVEHVSFAVTPPVMLTTHGGLLAFNENFNVRDSTGLMLETNVMNMTFTRPLLTMGLTNAGSTELDGTVRTAVAGTGVNAVASIDNLDGSTNSSPALRVTAHGSPLNGALSVATEGPVSAANTNRIATFANTNQLVSWLDNNGNWYANGNFNGNTFVNLSDRNAKENFQAISSREVLDKVAGLAISSWNYKANRTDRHIGPMAQDFYAAFGLGADDRHITTVDETGVALTAIQGLNEVVKEKDAKIAELEKRMATLEKMVKEMARK